MIVRSCCETCPKNLLAHEKLEVDWNEAIHIINIFFKIKGVPMLIILLYDTRYFYFEFLLKITWNIW